MEKLFYKIQYKLTVKEINEYADSIEDKTDIDCKVCDWMLKQVMSADDLGVTEEEYDSLLEETLA